MIHVTNNLLIPTGEVRFRTSRSGGPGGQNVNKLETRVELHFDVLASTTLTSLQRNQILRVLRSRIDSEGVLRIVSQESRSQWKNKQRAIEKFAEVLRKALTPRKKRVRTKPSLASRERRLQEKKRRGEKKRRRSGNSDE